MPAILSPRNCILALLCGILGLLVCLSSCQAKPFSSCDKRNRVVHVFVSYDTKDDKFSIQDTHDASTVAHAMFQNCVNSTGFAYLTVDTTNNYTYQLNSSMQAYAAGLAEGYITRELISLHYRNTQTGFCETASDDCRALEKFLRQNLQWLIENINANPEDDYWYQIRLVLEQLVGLQDGYKGTPGPISLNIDKVFGIYLLTIMAEIPSIQKAVSSSPSFIDDPGHCSALIKVIHSGGKVKDVLMSHDTWTNYNSMLRVLKRYEFYLRKRPTASEPVLGHSMTFSSYPGSVVSIDDFYLISSNMVVIETTNPVIDTSLFKKIKPQSVLESFRVMAANRLAEHGKDWSTTFSAHNSGTYNNQWMVVDLKQFDLYNQDILPGFLTVLEQIPGMVHYDDQTQTLLNSSYWASYNMPFYEDIYDASGIPSMAKKFGDFFTHDNCPRAKIFRRDQSKVTDVSSFIRLMRSNDFEHDPMSQCNCTPPYNAFNAISARGDLNLPKGFYPYPQYGFQLAGGTDMKMTTLHMAMDTLTFTAISGPTSDPLPVFSWSKAYNGSVTPHFGQPNVFDFGPVSFNGTF